MKRRSHRLPVADSPHDDWVDESWTVDCVCGVNFDDGEEMVNCDECGVWVHTRCSRYVRGEKSFACHKCKRKNERDDNEETEVAQLLVELPTKTLRMDDNPYSSSVAARRQVRRLWTEIPIEERVHVQGVPGGDPSLFSGLSSIFSRQLWKCTGCVPKKFNFQYREFPSWDEEENEQVKRNGEENGNTDNENTTGVLFSGSEENKSPTHLASSVGVNSLDENDKCEKVASPEQMRKLEGEDMEASLAQNTVNEDPRLPILRQLMMTSGKRKKEDAGLSEDRSEKKKARIVEMEGDSKKKATLASRTASTNISDSKQLEFYEDKACKSVKVNSDSMTYHLSYGPSVGGNNAGKDQKCAAAIGTEAEILNASGRNPTCDTRQKEEDDGYQVAPKVEYSPKMNYAAASGSLSTKHEVVRAALDSSNGNRGGSTQNIGTDLQNSEPRIEDTAVAGPEVKDNQNISGSHVDIISSSSDPNVVVKAESDEIHGVLNSRGVSSSEVSANNSSGDVKMKDAVISSSEASDQKLRDVDGTTAEGDDTKDDAQASAGDCQPKREPTGSEGSLDSRKGSMGHKHGSKALEEKSKFSDMISSSYPNKRKAAMPVGKSSSLPSTSVMSKSSTSGSRSSSNVQIQSNESKKRGSSDSNLGRRRENTSFDVVKDEERSGRSKKISKEVTKSSLSSASKASQSTKFSHASVHKRSLSDSNDATLHSSSKASKASSSSATTGSGKSASPLHAAGDSSAQIKVSDSGLPHKGEKSSLPGAQPTSKVNTSQMHPPVTSNPPATLSDEELALLLHQELNSSPRVPRVPRMRHAGSLPQLTSPTAASMLLKRTSSSGGKDNSSTNRRKPKDLGKDGSHSSRDISAEAKKMDRVPSGDTEG